MFSKEKFWQAEQEGTTANKYRGIFHIAIMIDLQKSQKKARYEPED